MPKSAYSCPANVMKLATCEAMACHSAKFCPWHNANVSDVTRELTTVSEWHQAVIETVSGHAVFVSIRKRTSDSVEWILWSWRIGL